MKRLLAALIASCLTQAIPAQTPPVLTLDQAQATALRNHPQIASARLNAQAADAIVTQVRSALLPAVTGSLTGAGAEADSAIAAGVLQTSALSTRVATGIGISQLLTDFGRTANLTESARLRATAQLRSVETTRAQILLRVDQAYYSTLAADTILKVARARLDMQRLTLRQVQALSDNGLKSTSKSALPRSLSPKPS
jgi:outer membrane protein